MIKSMQKWLRDLIPPISLFCLALLVWHALVRAYDVPAYLAPEPLDVLGAIRTNFITLTNATAQTAFAALCGFALSLVIGFLIAFLFSQSTFARLSLYPYAIFLQTVPIVAVAPLIVIWFGTGLKSVILVAFVVSLFPIITNATAGLTRANSSLKDLFRIYNASRLQILFKLTLPGSVPYLIAGARIASGLSVIGAIVGEFFAGYGTTSFGLGYLIILTKGQLDTDFLFAAIFASTLLGLVIFGVVNIVADVILSRWFH